ncbi:uncharacterized protein LOC120373609 [Mauremys reevesii]|uniref:uncharacterized protein LOC120373609 n=1 Tax=Mauremys reevesii TaxID=260615 RepID=UPI00193F5445|nr:uncharacterized protein LOC120373609 [Mauremys reevesii]
MTGTHCSSGSKLRTCRMHTTRCRMQTTAPVLRRFYKELDAILSGKSTSTVKTTVDTSVAHMPVESERSQEEKILDEEGDPEEEDDSEVRDTCSQELFSTPEEASQSQLSDVGEVQAGEEAPEMILGAQPPSLLLAAEWLCRIRRQPRRAKEDFLRDVMMHSVTEKQKLKEWQDSEKRDRKENARMKPWSGYGVPSRHTPSDTSSANQAASHPPSPTAAVAKLFPMLPPDTANTLLSTSWLQSIPAAFYSPPSQSSTANSHYPLHSHPSLCSLALLKYSTHCTVLQRRLDMIPGHTQIFSHPGTLPPPGTFPSSIPLTADGFFLV